MSARESIFPALAEWPAAVRRVPDAPDGAEALRLVAGAEGFERLARLTGLRRLWCFNVSRAKLEAISAASSIERLYVETLTTDDLAPLRRLERLRVLSLDSCTKLESLSALSSLESLEHLSLVNFKRVRSLAPLRVLVGLRGLVVAGGMWSRMHVESLAPVGDLVRLEYLNLANLQVEDASLAPLARLARLQELVCANFYSWEEFARLAAALPGTSCTWFEPLQPFPHASCKRCGRQRLVIPTGRGLRTSCQDCDAERLQSHVDRFAAVRRAAG